MKRDSDLAWELIGQDPVLRLELFSIEQHHASDDEMVAELMGFFARIERVIKLTAVLVEEDCMIVR
ncbi:MAG: hypothetical protein NTV01_17375 [Bacteroidia bacterium]|nr:hypothetical protein [Bacteroidia bacterium]